MDSAGEQHVMAAPLVANPRNGAAVRSPSLGGSSISGSDTEFGGRRRSRRQEERSQFTSAQREAVQDAVFQVNSVYCATMMLGILLIAVATYFEVRSVYVLVITYGQTCDRPLWLWLCVHSTLSIMRELTNQPFKSILLAFHAVWVVYGFAWFTKADACAQSSPELYNWVQIILLVAAVILLATTLLPMAVYLTIMMLVFLVNIGLISNQKAARAGTLDRLEVVEYNGDQFAPPDAPDDPRPAPDCCCCTEAFCPSKVIVATPCRHYYHKECIGDWLKLARTCPLCRSDLDDSVWSQAQSQHQSNP